ncbi:hypothetical protein [Sphingobacterium composti Ten et al. 2007 non Yoo et al. 2007]|uniref:hypothetical protein n=1 Tax=Sphingobacterium composti TaxID=363260 RepID=UPI001356A4D0|nr:hypothetical protein [Sphingobacterium composti Ten et al. 2007 non Yoo et al. 2007]
MNNTDNDKSIPSQIIFNRFHALSFYIESFTDRYNLKNVNYYNNLKNKQHLDLDRIRKLLWNSWSTEYSFLMTSFIDDSEFYKSSLHWNFPQAYYSVYLALTAFHYTQEMDVDQHEKTIKNFNNSIKNNHYPKSVSFYCKGLYKEFVYVGIQNTTKQIDNFKALAKIRNLQDSKDQIINMLKSTREQNAEHKRERVDKKDPKYHTKEGLLTKKFTKRHWDYIYKSIPETTVLNFLYRLRIKSNYHDVETFINADIDFRAFHTYLSNIVGYLNYIHEAYICKVIGCEEYEKILNSFPKKLNDDTSQKRYLKMRKILFNK